jgi:hypothetical protein
MVKQMNQKVSAERLWSVVNVAVGGRHGGPGPSPGQHRYGVACQLPWSHHPLPSRFRIDPSDHPLTQLAFPIARWFAHVGRWCVVWDTAVHAGQSRGTSLPAHRDRSSCCSYFHLYSEQVETNIADYRIPGSLSGPVGVAPCRPMLRTE